MLRSHIAPAVAVALLSAGLGLLTGCGGTEPAPYNDADVTFASEMVTHHEQAVEMVKMTDDRRVDVAVRHLADGIRDAQEPEIDEMTGWLKRWDKPTPGGSTSSKDDEPDATDDMNMGGSMAGMMSAEQLKGLAAAPEETFEQQWLQLMIEHHEGALAMARTELSDGKDPEALDLAEHIRATQHDEISQMQALLAR